jgi:hypothetical protein
VLLKAPGTSESLDSEKEKRRENGNLTTPHLWLMLKVVFCAFGFFFSSRILEANHKLTCDFEISII